MAPLIPYPLLQALSRLRINRTKGAAGTYEGDNKSPHHGSSIEFHDYREYEPGDDFRTIDWNIYHRLDKLFVKVFSEERNRVVTLLLDHSASMSPGQPPKDVYARQVAGALGYVGLWQGDEVRLGSLCPGPAWITPRLRGRQRIHTLFRALKRRDPGGEGDLFAALKGLAAPHIRPSHQELIIFITDLFDAQWEQTLELMARGRGDRVLIHILAPEDWRPTVTGPFQLMDYESGELLDMTLDPAALALYADVAASWLQAVQDKCRALNLDYYLIDTSFPLDVFFLRTMQERGLLSR